MTEYLTQIINQVQYTALLGNLDVPMPDFLRSFFDAFSVLNIDPVLILGRASIPNITFRLMFLMVGCIVPMIINMLLLVISKAWYEVLWYWSLLGGLLLMFVGLLGRFIPGTSTSSTSGANNVAVIGGALLGGSILVFLVKLLKDYLFPTREVEDEGNEPTSREMGERGRSTSIAQLQGETFGSGSLDVTVGGTTTAVATGRKESSTTRLERERREWSERFHRKRTLIHMLVTFVLLFAGLILTGIVSISAPGVTETTKEALNQNTYKVVGYILLGMGGVAFCYMMLNVFRCGRKNAFVIVRFLEHNLLRILLVAVLVTFIPIVGYCLDAFMCTKYSCPAGTLFNPNANRPIGSYSKDAKYFCDQCSFGSTAVNVSGFRNTQAQCTNTFRAQYCPAASYQRLFNDPTAPCDGDIGYITIVIAAVLVLFTFIGGVPYLFYEVTNFLTARLEDEAEIVDSKFDNEDDRIEEDWLKRQAAIPVVAGSIYAPFNYRMRHYNLVDLCQRFVFLIVLQIIAPFTNIATILVLVGHCAAFGALIYLKPYATATLQGFARLLSFANVLNAVLMVSLWAKGSTQALIAFAYTAIAVNASISIVGGLVLFYYEWTAQRKRKEDFDQEEARRNAETEAAIANDSTKHPEDIADEIERFRYIIKRRHKKNEDATSAANEATMKLMSTRFMVMGFIVAIAAAAAVLSIIREPTNPAKVGSNIFYLNLENQLTGYSNWTDFTDHCCCSPGTATFDDFNMTERWVCGNGLSTTRGRQSKDGKITGIPIRGMCNTSFNYGCVLTINSFIDRAELSCTDSVNSLLDGLRANAEARTLYW